ncbi:MAG: ribonuclease J [Oscillospiraceae bacterium]|nr:ribonuclease J [Oscillospiraceae bacterium]MBQ7465811.1 ribonuclease J [Oscillospiraceae bacterium]MBR0211078.1 ribonuclease J [Oscillospiraceae bacterium]
MAEKMKIIPLGGLNEIGKNMTAYEYGGEIIVVDCGMAFPGDDMYGIDCVIPDVSYLLQNHKRLRGLFITHGHEDHIGAIPYVLKQVNMPIYCTRLTAGLIKLKLQEHGLLNSTKLITVEAGQTVKAGKFQVEFIHVNHSIADSVAFAIHTNMGVIVHTGDFKIDSTPIDGDVIDLARFGQLGREGVLALLADSTNVERPGYTMSERAVGATFKRQFTGCQQRIIVTTFASNVHRIQQVIDAAHACGRKVAVTGRSMENIMKVSTELGYMKVPKGTLMELNRLQQLPARQQVIVTTGSQGEEMSALYRMAFGSHKQVDIGPGDKVILSASAIPGNEVTVGRMINELFRRGAEVVYDKADMLHVSGHACQEELKIIHALTRPRFFIPLHGEQRMLQIHKRLAQDMGMAADHICVAENGSVIELTAKHMKCETAVPAGEVFVDGGGIGEVGSVVLNDRKLLASDGMVVVVLSMSSHDHQLLCEPEIVTRGFVYVKESEGLLQDLRRVAMDTVDTMNAKKRRDENEIHRAVRSAVSSYLYKRTRRSPMVIPMVTWL